ncbi:MAG TPA: glycosyltransferase, partial [Acidimicrobiales bacterium]
LRGELEALVDELGVSCTVHFHGFVTNPHAIVANCDVYCLPSQSEGFSLGLLEAMAVGTSVISTDCGSGPREIIDKGAYGTIVGVDDEAAFAVALADHLLHPEDFREVETQAQGRAAEFDLDVMAEAYATQLEAVNERMSYALHPTHG